MAVHVTRAGVALTVGIILVTGLIIGGLFWAKNSGEQARRDEAIKVAEQNLEKNSDQGVALNKGDEQSGNKSGEQSNNNSQSTGSNQQNEQQSGSTSGQTQATELPQTGPADNGILTLIALALLVFLGVSYWHSRRTLLEA